MHTTLLENYSPLDQFEVRDLLSLDAPLLGNTHFSITNIGLYLTIGASIAFLFKALATNYNRVVSNNWSVSQETIYATVHSIVVGQINAREGQVYFPFIYALFVFILVNNLIGMVMLYFDYSLDEFFTLSSLIISKKKVSGLSSTDLSFNYISKRKKHSKYSTSSLPPLGSSLSGANGGNHPQGSSLGNLKNKGLGIVNPVNTINPYYLTGFIDGEGCFNLSIYKNSELAVGWHIIPVFKISLHVKDKALLESIQRSLGVGSIYKHGKNSLELRVNGLKNLNVLINHLDNYPLITQKFGDFVLFKEAVKLIGLREHLTKEGLLKLVSLKASLNKGLSGKLKSEFSSVIPAIRSKGLSSEIKDMNWLRGFVEAEGSFHVIVQKLKGNTWVSLIFTLTQHSRDKVLMESLIEFLGCGRCSSASTRKEVNFIVSTYSEISKIIIPLFQEYPLLGFKQKDFLDFVKVADLIKSKDHLTKEGLSIVMDIKNKMNQRRSITDSDSLQLNNLVTGQEKIPVVV